MGSLQSKHLALSGWGVITHANAALTACRAYLALRSCWCALLMLVMLPCTRAFSALSPAYTAGNAGRLLVRFSATTPPEAKVGAHAEAGAIQTLEKYWLVPGLELVQVPTDAVVAAKSAYENNPNVLYVVVDAPIISVDRVPDDEHFGELWGLHNLGQPVNGHSGTADADIDAVQAWDKWTGEPDPQKPFLVAVIDTGVNYNHEDLAGNMWVNEAEHDGIPGFDDDGNGYVDDVYGYDFGNGDSDPMDVAGHGTYVAGIIAARANNGKGVTGVNWTAKIVAVKIFKNNGELALPSSVVQALQYCAANKIRVSNNSYGWGSSPYPPCYGFQPEIYEEIQTLNESVPGGHIFVASAGNYGVSCGDNHLDNDNAPYPHVPASYDLANIIAVAATDNDDLLWDGSHYGKTRVDLGAPGVNIYSTWLNTVLPYTNYKFDTGTSAAAPYVTGVVSLVWSRYPDWNWQQVRQRVLDTVRPVASLCNDPERPEVCNTPVATGGVVNAMHAVWYDCNENGVADGIDMACGSRDCFQYETNCCLAHAGAGCDDPWIEWCLCHIWGGIFSPCCDPGPWTKECAVVAKAECGATCEDAPDGVLDECQASPDCNKNRVPDAVDVRGGPPPNCAAGTSADCNQNCVPDECEIDKNRCPDPENCPFFCDPLASACSPDCNENGVPDQCDAYGDCDGVPDECGACCGMHAGWYGCRNATQDYCDGLVPAGTFVAGSTCASVHCGEYACCVEDDPPCRTLSYGDCEVAAGYWVAEVDCASNPCVTGACCKGNCECVDQIGGQAIDRATCNNAGGAYIGGAHCEANPRGCLVNPCACPCGDPVDAPQPEPNGVKKNRYVSLIGTNPGRQTGIRVKLASLVPQISNDTCYPMWVGEPADVSELSGSGSDTLPPTFKVAQLQCGSHYRDWGAINGVVHVYGSMIVPGAWYQVEAVLDCDGQPGAEVYSSGLPVGTARWGDIVPPNDCVDFNDIAAVVGKFRNVQAAPTKARADIAPATPDRLVNFVDISNVVDAFRGWKYPVSWYKWEPCP